MLFKIFSLLSMLQSKIYGHPEVSLSVSGSRYVFTALWLRNNVAHEYEYEFSLRELAEEEDFFLALLMQKVNKEYKEKVEGTHEE